MPVSTYPNSCSELGVPQFVAYPPVSYTQERFDDRSNEDGPCSETGIVRSLRQIAIISGYRDPANLSDITSPDLNH